MVKNLFLDNQVIDSTCKQVRKFPSLKDVVVTKESLISELS